MKKAELEKQLKELKIADKNRREYVQLKRDEWAAAKQGAKELEEVVRILMTQVCLRYGEGDGKWIELPRYPDIDDWRPVADRTEGGLMVHLEKIEDDEN